MKKNMKIMKIYEIEKNYQKHKLKLLSIHNNNPKSKTREDINHSIEKTQHYKRNRLQTQCFNERQKMDKIYYENLNLHHKMLQLHERQGIYLRENKINRQHSFYKHRSPIFTDQKIKRQNFQMKSRLLKTKSSYYKVTEQSKDYSKKKKRISHQQEVIYLLERQLGIKSSVVFPQVKSNSCKNKKISFTSFTDKKQQPVDKKQDESKSKLILNQ